jgi:anti-sigma-K factor RskA
MNRNEELLTRWIDGELDAAEQAEFDAVLKADPEFAERVKAEAAQLGDALRAELPATLEPPYPDFFNSQIAKRIREEDASARPVSAGSSASPSVWSWLKSPFTLGAAAAACVVIFFTRGDVDTASGNPSVVSTYAPDPTVQVSRAEFDEEAEATVIMLTGLARIPDEVEVGGQTIATYVPAGPRGFGRFYTEDRQLAYVMETDADGAPRFSARRVGG